jgi:REP element-mobilizing transposase RayT
MTRSRYRIFEEEFPYFLTSTVVGWLPLFCHPELVQIVFESWRFLQQHRGVQIYGYVVLENHVHWIAAGPELAKHIGNFKSFTARKIIDTLTSQGRTALLEELRFHKLRNKIDQEYQLWQEGFHPKQIQNDEMMRQKLDYLHNNPVRRGYVDQPADWRYSSARIYAGRSGLLEVVTDWH